MVWTGDNGSYNNGNFNNGDHNQGDTNSGSYNWGQGNNGSYNIGFTMDLACKDLGFAHQLGRELGVPLELAGLTEQIFRRHRAPLRVNLTV